MKKLLPILFAAAMFFSLLAGCSSNEEVSPAELKKVGDFVSQPTDAPETLTLPQGMMGNGLKVAGLDNENLSGEAANIPWAGEALKFYVTLYNANDYENKFTLFAIADREQVDFCVDGNPKAQPFYQVTMPPKSYTVVPICVASDQFLDRDVTHELWFLVDGITQSNGIDTDLNRFGRIIGSKLNIVCGERYWYTVEKEKLMPSDIEIQEMKISFTSRAKFDVLNEREILAKNGKFNVRLVFNGRQNGLAQTFMLVDYQAIPLTEDGDSVVWCEQTDREESFEQTFDAAGMEGKEIFLLTLPVGRDGMPDVSERYVLTEQ